MRWQHEKFPTWDMTSSALRQFGVLIGTVLLACGGYGLWRHHAGADAGAGMWLGAGSLLVVAGLLSPRLLCPLYVLWMSLAYLMGLVMTRVVLTLVFIFVVTPLAIVTRITGKDQLGPGMWRNGAESCWQRREVTSCAREEYERQY